MPIPQHRVGPTQVSTSKVGFGCASIGNLFEAISDAQAEAVLSHAYAYGIRYFDTAPHYGRGRAEARLGQFLRNKTYSDVTLSTKVGRVLTSGKTQTKIDGFADPLPNDVHYDYSADGIAQSLAGSRKRLGRDYIDIVLVHDIGAVTHGGAHQKHLDALLTSGLPYLQQLRAAGDIGAIGIGVNENEVCLEILDRAPLDVILLAGRWTLLDRTAEHQLIPRCKDTGTSLILGGIFNSGILATGAKPGATFNYAPASAEIVERVKSLETQAQNAGTSLPQAAIDFAMARDNVCSVLMGTGKLSSLDRNLKMFGLVAPARGAHST